VAGHVVPPAADGDLEAALAGEAYGGLHVGRAVATSHQGRPPIDQAVVDTPGVLVGRIRRRQDGAGHLCAQVIGPMHFSRHTWSPHVRSRWDAHEAGNRGAMRRLGRISTPSRRARVSRSGIVSARAAECPKRREGVLAHVCRRIARRRSLRVIAPTGAATIVTNLRDGSYETDGRAYLALKSAGN